MLNTSLLNKDFIYQKVTQQLVRFIAIAETASGHILLLQHTAEASRSIDIYMHSR